MARVLLLLWRNTKTHTTMLTDNMIMRGNVLNYAAAEDYIWKNMVLPDYGGYKAFTTCYSDLSIAEYMQLSGQQPNAVESTYNTVMREWLKNIKYITEFCMALNHKSWEFADIDPVLSQQYVDLFYKCQDTIYEHYEGNDEALSYYYSVTD